MTQISTNTLRDEIRSHLTAIDAQADAIKMNFMAQLPVQVKPTDQLFYRAMDANGRPILLDVILAKTQCLSALAQLQSK